MSRNPKQPVRCQICKQQKTLKEMVPAELIRNSIVRTIQKEYPDWSPKGFICINDLNHFRAKHVQEELETEKGELSLLEAEVVRSMKEHELLAKNINAEFSYIPGIIR